MSVETKPTRRTREVGTEVRAVEPRPLESPVAHSFSIRAAIIALGVTLAIVGAVLFVVWRQHKSDAAANSARTDAAGRPSPVVVAIARKGDLPIYLTGLGTVTPLNSVSVHSRVDGELDEVAYAEGQMVKEKDLLAKIDPRPFQVQLEQAQGQYAKDKATLDNANLDLARYESASNAVNEQQISAQKSLVAQLEGTLKSDQAQIDSAQLQLTYCEIRSPINGRVGLREVDKGNVVHANDANGLVMITQLQPISVVFTIPQDQIQQVMQNPNNGGGLVVDIYNRDLTKKLASGSLEAVDNQVDQTTGTVKLKATIANDDNALFPLQFVNARLLVDTRRGSVLVPSAAIQRGPDFSYVFVVTGQSPDQAVTVRHVTPGPSEGDQTAIVDGLNPGERVVIDGVDKLQDGSKVSVGEHGATSRAFAGAGGATTRAFGGTTRRSRQ
jgi:membrane fusion protein, multidrug efflux system